MNNLLKTAQYYRCLGFSVIAVRPDKKSVFNWKQYQHVIISQRHLKIQFDHPLATGIAVICGTISENLEVIDMDEKNDPQRQLFRQFAQAIEEYNPQLLGRLTIAASRNNGYHFFYKCSEIGNSTILARRPSTDQELHHHPQQKVKVLIETKGNGGYVIVYPSPGYRFLQNGLHNIPNILPAEREKLIQIARGFNTIKSPSLSEPIPSIHAADPRSPFNDYNSRGNVIALLEKHGWLVIRSSSLKTHLRRPGDTEHETSGDFHHGLGLFSVFTSSTDFIRCTGYRPYAVYAILECGGNFKLAAKKLLKEGYGIPYKNRT